MTKEVIQGKIDVLIDIYNTDRETMYNNSIVIIDKLKKQLKQTKSIEDIKQEEYQRGFTDAMNQYKQVMLENMEKAFKAGRKQHWNTNDSQSRIWEDDRIFDYESFEDYINQNEIK